MKTDQHPPPPVFFGGRGPKFDFYLTNGLRLSKSFSCINFYIDFAKIEFEFFIELIDPSTSVTPTPSPSPSP